MEDEGEGDEGKRGRETATAVTTTTTSPPLERSSGGGGDPEPDITTAAASVQEQLCDVRGWQPWRVE